MLGLEELLERRPSQLSGGQRQRVAMGRAIAREPQAFLLDEPLSNLDAKLRVGMRASLTQLHQRLGVTTVYVTHDQVEAMTLGQRVAVMRKGKIVQVDTPHRLYAEPRDLFVAGFIGSPAMNLVEATVEGGIVRFGQFSLPIPPDMPVADGPSSSGSGPRASRTRRSRPTLPAIDVSVQVLEDLGSDAHVIFLADARPVTPEALEAADETHGLIAGAGALLTARVHAGTAIRAGERASLGVDTRGLHFFDPATGLRLAPAATPEPALAQ